MNLFEKTYSILAIIFAILLIILLIVMPELRYIDKLLPLCTLGFAVNTALMFIVLRDIFYRPFRDIGTKYLWLALVLLIWPSILYYLPRYGFRPRTMAL